VRTYEIIIKPQSAFGTPLKGDTLFGQFCWQVIYNPSLFNKTLKDLLKNYNENPFIVISSAYPKNDKGYILKRPELPSFLLRDLSSLGKKEISIKKKELKNKRWMLVSKDKPIKSFKNIEYLSSEYIKEYIKEYLQTHNKINRITNKTEGEKFAPFSVSQEVYHEEIELVIFVGIDETVITIEQVKESFIKIGEFGFGKDSSTGLGKFKVLQISEIELSALGSSESNACYTLSPCVPEKNIYSKMFFTPFIRFGKHGDILAKSKNPFKNPVIMADESAVFVPKNKDIINRKFVGTAIYNLSKSQPETVSQGYSLIIPVKLEE